MDFIYKGLGYVIRFCYYDIGFQSYALALFWFALFTKIVLLPISIKQQKNQIKGAKLRPKMLAIEKKYAGRNDRPTLQKKQQEIAEMQQREGYSVFSGCLPLILQLVFVIILYNIIREPLSYICMLDRTVIESLATQLGGDAKNQIGLVNLLQDALAQGQSFTELAGITLPNFTLFGIIDLSVNPAFWTWALLIPVLVFGSQFFTMWLTKKMNPMLQMQAASNPDAAVSNKIFDFLTPAMTLFFAFSLPSALGYYWICQSVVTIIQLLLLNKFMPMPTFTPEELKAAERELKGKAPKRTASDYDPDAPRPRSLHHIDDDDETPYGSSPVSQKAPAPKKNSGIQNAPLKQDGPRAGKNKNQKDN